MQPDSKLREEDIAIIEKEVNKKKQKRHKAKKEGSMISPLATSRRDTQPANPRNWFNNEDINNVDGMEENLREMQVDQLMGERMGMMVDE